jgi:hypothetical protein
MPEAAVPTTFLPSPDVELEDWGPLEEATGPQMDTSGLSIWENDDGADSGIWETRPSFRSAGRAPGRSTRRCGSSTSSTRRRRDPQGPAPSSSRNRGDCGYLIETRSTTNTSVSSGPMTPPAPRLP